MKSTKTKRSGRKASAEAKSSVETPSLQPELGAADELALLSAAAPTQALLEQEASATRAAAPDETAKPAGAVVLPANCSLRDAGALRAALMQCLDDEQAVPVDARAVERIDTASLQVLVAFVRERVAQARAVEWLGCNEVFIEAVRLLDLESHLSIPATVGASS